MASSTGAAHETALPARNRPENALADRATAIRGENGINNICRSASVSPIQDKLVP